ncbi:MAG: hypothetical protein AB7L76_07040, partial [Burkholderiaceae bacterium]
MSRALRLPQAHHVVLSLIVAGVFAFLLLPILVIALGSLEGKFGYHIRIPPNEFSLAGYFDIPGKYLRALGTSLGIAAATALLSTILGAMAALALVRGELRSRPAIESFF